MKQKILILLILTFTNCISMAYSKKYSPEEDSYVSKEFSPLKPITIGRGAVDSENKSYQFDSILIGKNRYLNFQMDSDKKIINLSDSFTFQEGKPEVILLKTIGKDLFKDDIQIKESDLIQIGLKPEEIQNEMQLIHVLDNMGYYQNAQILRIKRSEDNKSYFKIQNATESIRIWPEKISWQVRNKTIYLRNSAFYYLGFIFTIPLDIITSPFQAIGVVYILMSGGFVK